MDLASLFGRSRAIAVTLALVASATACRSESEAETETESTSAPPVATTAPVVATPAPPATSGSTDASTELSQPPDTTAAPPDDVTTGYFGSLDPVCGPAPEGATLSATGSQGVMADSIKIGTIADPSNPARPGLGQEMFDASKVFVDWCNSLGGINGRRIDLTERDAALFNYQGVIREACAADFALVGGGGTGDATGQTDRIACLLPDVPALQASLESRGADLVTGPVPADKINLGIARYLEQQYPGSAERVGIITGNLEGTLLLADQIGDAGKTFGWNVAYRDQYNPMGEPTFQPYAQKLKDEGIKGLVFVSEPETMALMLQALDDIGYQLDWILGGPNTYDPKLIASGGQSLDRNPVYAWALSTPFELAAQSQAIADYQALFEQYLPDASPTASQGVASFAAWLLFASAADACGVDLTRRCLWERLTTTTGWTAGGLLPPSSGPAGQIGECFVVMRARSDGFAVEPFDANEGPFNCDASNLVQLDPKYLEPGVRLQDVGRSIDELN